MLCYEQGAAALAGTSRQDFLRRYKFAIDPATDDHPFFFQFFKWESLGELLSMEGRGGLPLLEWSYPILILTLGQALAASVVLILAPLGLLPGFASIQAASLPPSWVLWRARIGLSVCRNGIHPALHSVPGTPVVCRGGGVTAFLLFAGFGSRCSEILVARLQTLHRAYGRRHGILLGCAGIVALGLIYVAILPPILEPCLGLPVLIKMVITLLLIAPLAFCMGMPFPLGLAQAGEAFPDLLPWAWGVNGCASVLSSIQATILAMHYGFRMVVVAAVGARKTADASQFTNPTSATGRAF